MRTINMSFDAVDFNDLKNAKKELSRKSKESLNWERFFLKVALGK